MHPDTLRRRSVPILQATWGERPPQGGCDRVVFKPTPEPELLASVMGGFSLLLWPLGTTEDPQPVVLEPAHGQLITSCDFDETGSRLLAGDAEGLISVYGVAEGGRVSSFKAHDSAVCLLCHTGTPGGASSNLLLTGSKQNLELKLWNLSGGAEPSCVQQLNLTHPTVPSEGMLPLLGAFEPRHGVLLLSYCPSLAETATDLIALRLNRAADPARSSFASVTAVASSLPIVSLAADAGTGSDLPIFCVHPSAVQCLVITEAQLAGGSPIAGAEAMPPAASAPPPPPPNGASGATEHAQAQQLEEQLQKLSQLVGSGRMNPAQAQTPPMPPTPRAPPPTAQPSPATPQRPPPPQGPPPQGPPPGGPPLPGGPPPMMQMQPPPPGGAPPGPGPPAAVMQQLAQLQQQMGAMMANQQQLVAALARQQEKSDAMLRQRLAEERQQLASAVQASLLPAVTQAVTQAVEASAAATQAAMAAQLKEAVSPPLDRGLQKLSTSLPATISAQLGPAMGAAVSEAFKQAFATTLLPGYERASQKMFEDMHEAFKRGLDQFQQPLAASLAEQRQAASAAQAQISQAVSESATTMREAVGSAAGDLSSSVAKESKAVKELVVAVAKKMEKLDKAAAAARGPAAPGAAKPPPAATPVPAAQPAAPAVPPPAPAATAAPPATAAPAASGILANFQLTMEAKGLIQKQEFEKAFALVLGASNLELLVWLCGQVQPALLLGATPGPSQIILASLVQQLGFDLNKDTAVKLPWLHETLQHLKPQDALIASSAGRILQSVAENMRAAASVLGQPTHANHAQFQNIALVLSNLIQSTQAPR